MRLGGIRWRRTGVSVALALVSVLPARVSHAAGVVGTGTPESCTEAAFAAALAGGGTVTFDCGPTAYTLVLTTPQTITTDTTIDAADDVTLSGDDAIRPLAVAPGVTLALRDIKIQHGSAATDGGCIHNAGTLTLTSSTVEACSAVRDGGGIFNDAGATLQLVGSLIVDNTALRHGGGVGDAGTSVTISGSTVTSNDAAADGGGLYVTGNLSVVAAIVTLNSAQRGGGLFVASGTATLDSSTVSANAALVSGAGLHEAAGATLQVTGGEIRNNQNAVGGAVTGAGLYNEGTATLTRVTLRTNSGTQGGALYQAAGTLDVVDSTITGNIANSGGGLTVMAPATLTNATLSGNLAPLGAALESYADVWLQNVTVADNRAQPSSPGSALYRVAGTLALRNTLVALNFPADCFGTVTSAGNNLGGDATCVLTDPSDLDDVAPLIGALQFNGGPTKTHLLALGSPAVDAGTPTGCPVKDQRGHTRPVGAACDIGSVERQAGDPTLTTTSTTSSTSTSLPPTTSTSLPPSTTSTTEPPTTSTSLPTTTSTTEPPTTSTSLPPTTSTSVTSTSVTSTTSTSVPPTTSTSLPPTTSTSLPPTTSTSVTSTTSTSAPPTTTTSVTTTSSTLASTTSTSLSTTTTFVTTTSATSPSSSTTTTETSVTTATSTVTSTSIPGPESCANGIDDDGDTLIDCRDPDCADSAACPDACGTEAQFSVLRCRVAALTERTAFVTDHEPFASDARAVLDKASAAAGGAEVACDDGNRPAARRGLRRLGKRAARYRKKVGAKPGREAIPEQGVRDELRNEAVAIRMMTRALRKSADCTPAP